MVGYLYNDPKQSFVKLLHSPSVIVSMNSLNGYVVNKTQSTDLVLLCMYWSYYSEWM